MSGDRTCNACGQTERECLRGGGKCCNVCQHSDPAPSPSVPDPSDERALIVEISKAHKRHPGDPRRCYCGQFYGEGRGGWTYDSAPAEHLADVLLPALAAARPTSLPEAPEPDEMFYAIRRVDGEDLWDDGIKWAKANGPDDWDAADRDHDEPTGYEIVRMYAVPIARRTVHHDLSSDDRVEALPTPSAPPVAVDPEPESFVAIMPTGWMSDPDDDGVQIGPTPWCATVERWAGDPYPKGAPTHWTWELVNPDGTVELSGCETDDPAAFLSRIVDLLTPAVDPEAGAGA